MTDAQPDTREPSAHKRDTLWVTDAEIIRRMGCDEKIGYRAIRGFDEDRHSGFPPKQKLWGDRRYWPAVKAYLDHVYGLKSHDRRG